MVADGSDPKLVAAILTAAKGVKADVAIVAPKVGGAITGDKLIAADLQLAGGASVLFDTVFVALSKAGAEELSTEAAAVAWVHDAYAHCKVIGATADAKPLLDAAGVKPDAGVVSGADVKAFLTAAANGRERTVPRDRGCTPSVIS